MEKLTTDSCRQVIKAMAATIHEKRDELSALDAALGDGDHGFNMDTALQSVVKEINYDEAVTPADLFEQAGSILMNKMGGASGIIFGSFFSGGGRAVRGKRILALPDVTLFFESGADKVQKRGKAKEGDKTMLDALIPAVEALKVARNIAATAEFTLPEAMHAAAISAQRGAEATTDYVAQHGRAKFLGERSQGHQDAGAVSMALMINAWADVVRDYDTN